MTAVHADDLTAANSSQNNNKNNHSTDSHSQTDSQAHAAQAFSSMRAQFEVLQGTTANERIKVLARLRDHIMDNFELCVGALMRECGKTRTDAAIEFLGTLDWLKWIEENGAEQLADEKIKTPLLLLGKKSRIIHEPLGVVLLITPWNYPLHTGLTQIFSAFACGNTVVYKPSEITPMRGVYEALFEPFELLKNSVHIAYGDGELGRALIDERPEKIFFTGSTRTGRAICKQAAEYLIPVDTELGGKDPMIVFDSANLERAVAGAVWGGFTHNGQSCSAVERLYVQAGVYDEFVKMLKEATDALVQKPIVDASDDPDGNVDLGRVTVNFQYDIIKSHVDDAIEKGATVVAGGREIDRDKLQFAPTVLTDVSDDMLTISRETFGPVIPVAKFNTEAEAVKLANNSEYGLQASVFTGDMAQADRVMRKLEVGGVSINNVNLVEGNPWLSFGGRKLTGTGRARGVEGFLAYTRSKHVLIDPNSNKIEPNWYPYTSQKYSKFIELIKHHFSRDVLQLPKMGIAGLTLEKIAMKKRK